MADDVGKDDVLYLIENEHPFELTITSGTVDSIIDYVYKDIYRLWGGRHHTTESDGAVRLIRLVCPVYRYPDPVTAAEGFSDLIVSKLALTPEGVQFSYGEHRYSGLPCSIEVWEEWYTQDRTIEELFRDMSPTGKPAQLIKRPRPSGTKLTDWKIGSSKDARGILSALMNPQDWMLNNKEFLYECIPEDLELKLIFKNKTNPPPEAYDDPGLLALWLAPIKQIIDQYDNLTGVIHILMQIHWLEHKQEDDWAWITPKDIIDYRGMKTWKGKILDKELIKISNAFRAILGPEIEGLSSLLYIRNDEKKKPVPTHLRYRGPLWFSSVIDIPSLPGFKEDMIQAIHYYPNEWLKACIAPYTAQLMKIAPVLVKYDLNKQRKHFRMGVTLDYYFKVNPEGVVKIKMGTLLEGAGIPISARDLKHPGDFIKTIEEDVFPQLQKDDVIQSYECTDKTQLPGHNPLAKWLKKTWIFTPPTGIGLPYFEIHEKEQKYIERSIKAQEAAQQKALEAVEKKKIST